METSFFRRLFEVRILHEYYLAQSDNSEFFALSETEQSAILSNKLFYNQYDIWRDLEIELSEETRLMFKNLNLYFVPLKTGFFVGIKINPPVGSAFFPFSDQGNEWTLSFILKIKNSLFKNFTNTRLWTPTPSIYYFSNFDPSSIKTFPSLSNPVGAYREGKFYEVGELAQILGETKEAIIVTDSDAAAGWRRIDSTGFANENDLIVLPSRFEYEFEQSVSQAQFILKDLENATLKTINLNTSGNFRSASLDFFLDDSTPSKAILDGHYTLEVAVDGGFSDIRHIYIDNANYSRQNFGIVEISNQQTNPDFSIFNVDGSLRDPFPVFEIRLKSRLSYWRYRSDSGKSFDVTPKTDPYLVAEGGALRTIEPLPMIAAPLEFIHENPLIPRVFLPNPPDSSLRIENDGRIYSDIYLSKIKDLIAEIV